MADLGIGEILLAIAAFGAVEYGVSALAPKPKMPGTPAAPDPTKAAEDAKAAQTKQRQTLLQTGGITNVTGGSAVVLGEDVKSVSLTGA